MYSSRNVSYSSQVIQIISLAAPMMVGYFLQFLLSLVAIIFIGHLENGSGRLLAAAGLAVLFGNITGYSVVYGLASCYDTLGAQAYGAGQLMLVGRLAQRTSVFLIFCTLPSVVVWCFCARILVAFGQDPNVAELSGKYVLCLIPGLFGTIQLEVAKKYMSCQQVNHLYPLALLTANCVHPFVCYLFIFVLDLGFLGSPLAISFSLIFSLFVFIILIWRGGYHEASWPGILSASELFSGWWELATLGIPGMLMLCLEWWAFEICSFFAGIVGTLPLEAYVVATNLNGLAFMIPLGLSISSSSLIGNYLGSNEPEMAQSTAYLTAGLNLFVLFSNGMIAYFGRNSLGYFFTSQSDVVAVFAEHEYLAVLVMVFDGYNCVVSTGVLRGCGLQRVGAALNLFCYYALAIPISYLLTFNAGFGLNGIWIGLSIGVGACCVISSIIVYYINWGEQSRLAQQRTEVAKNTAPATSFFSFLNGDASQMNRESAFNTTEFVPVFVVEDEVEDSDETLREDETQDTGNVELCSPKNEYQKYLRDVYIKAPIIEINEEEGI